MNDTTKLPASKPSTALSQAERILEEARKDAGFDKMLKFKKGAYICDGEEIPLGSEYVAHPIGWTKMWVKFVFGSPVDRRVYRVARAEIPPDRAFMPDLEQDGWERDPAGRPIDPWSYQYLLPLEPTDGSGTMVVFVTGSWGGRRAVSDLCAAWSRKSVKDPGCGLPVIKLGKSMMPSKKWGDVVKPDFPIVGWDSRIVGGEIAVDSQSVEPVFDDDIPF